MFAAPLITLSADARPVIDSIPQSLVATLPHDNNVPLSTATGDWSYSGIAAQRVVISISERLGRLCEHRGGDHPTRSRQGKEECHVAMLTLLAFTELIEHGLNPSGDVLTLLV
jgi:hypothetical protein